VLGALNRLSVRSDEGKPWHEVGGRYDDKRGVREGMGRRARCSPGCPNAAQDDHEHDGGRVERGREGTLLDTRYKEGRAEKRHPEALPKMATTRMRAMATIPVAPGKRLNRARGAGEWKPARVPLAVPNDIEFSGERSESAATRG